MPVYTRVGVVRGGPSPQYEESLNTGSHILSTLSQLGERYEAHDILITKDGTWHLGGVPSSLARIAPRVDVVINALHGRYGEDGTIQRDLDRFHVPYTGSRIFPALVSLNKGMTRDFLGDVPVHTPAYEVVRRGDDLGKASFAVFTTLSLPLVVKPVDAGSSIGMTRVQDFFDLEDALAEALRHSPVVLVEEYLEGREATVGVIEGYRGEPFYTLPEAHVRGVSREYVCPGPFSQEEKRALSDAAIRAHKALGLRDYSRSDFVLTDKGVYMLEANALPSLSQESPFVRGLSAVGSHLGEFLDHIIRRARSIL